MELKNQSDGTNNRFGRRKNGRYRNYGDKADCEKDYDVESTIKYDDWEHRVFERILTARPPRNGLYVLPFAIKEMMEW